MGLHVILALNPDSLISFHQIIEKLSLKRRRTPIQNKTLNAKISQRNQFMLANRAHTLLILRLHLQLSIATNTKPSGYMETLNTNLQRGMVQLIPSSPANSFTLV
jgi:hypothetical protein